MQKIDKDDPRLIFLEAQQKILDKLLASDHFAKDAKAADWLADILTVFMKSLENAVQANIAGMVRGRQLVRVPPGDMLQFMDGKKAGPWWAAYDEKAKGEYDGQTIKTRTEKEIYGMVMAEKHILGDLKAALLYHGAGTDADWKTIGNYVQEAIKEIIESSGLIRYLGGKTGVNKLGEKLGFAPDIQKGARIR